MINVSWNDIQQHLKWLSAASESSNSRRVLRGGAWYSVPRDLRAANRYEFESALRSNGIGLQISRVLPLAKTN